MSENPVYGDFGALQYAGLLAGGALVGLGNIAPSATTVPFSRVQGDSDSHATFPLAHLNSDRKIKKQILYGIIAKSLGPNSIFLPKNIDTRTAVFSKYVIQQLPDTVPLPKIAPDVEGGLLMVWEGQRTVLATIEGNKLHLVAEPGTLESRHFDDLELTGLALPADLLRELEAA